MTRKTKSRFIILITLLPLMVAFQFYVMPHIRILAPSLFGLQRLTNTIYVDPSMNRYEIWKTYKKIKNAETSIIEFFGNRHSSPMIIACKAALCYKRFGGQKNKSDTGNIIRLDASDIKDRYIIRFKLAKLELQKRLGSKQSFGQVPVWFREGLATYLSGDPRFGKLAWYQYIRSSPKTRDIQSLDSLQDWQRARRQKIPVQILARQEFARWFDETGQTGLLKFIGELRTGHPFKKAFAEQMLMTLKYQKN